MSARGPYRRHSPQFNIQLCTDSYSILTGERVNNVQRLICELFTYYLEISQLAKDFVYGIASCLHILVCTTFLNRTKKFL